MVPATSSLAPHLLGVVGHSREVRHQGREGVGAWAARSRKTLQSSSRSPLSHSTVVCANRVAKVWFLEKEIFLIERVPKATIATKIKVIIAKATTTSNND